MYIFLLHDDCSILQDELSVNVVLVTYSTIELESLRRDTAPDHGSKAAVANGKRVGPVVGRPIERHFQRLSRRLHRIPQIRPSHQTPPWYFFQNKQPR